MNGLKIVSLVLGIASAVISIVAGQVSQRITDNQISEKIAKALAEKQD